jgi:L-arabinose isomerase
MWNTYFNPYRIFQNGPEISFYSYKELKDISDDISDKEVKQYLTQLKSKYEVDGELEDVKFEASARYSLGLDKLMDKYNLDGMTLNDVSTELFETIGLRPGFYPESINQKKRFVCPEGDLGLALSVYILKLLSNKQVNVVEPFYIDKSRGIFCGGHAGPNDYNGEKSTSNVKIAIDKRFAKTSYKYAGAPFAWLRIPPAEMTMIHISQIKDEIKLVASKVTSLEGPHKIQGYTHSEFSVDGDINLFFEKILTIGTTQHFVVVEGDYIKQLESLSKLCNFSFYTV